jgi:internalin A
MQINEIATKLDISVKDLKEQPTLELVMAFPHSYACNNEGHVIALNLSGRDFKIEQIRVLLGIPELEALNLSESKLAKVAIPKSLSKLQFLDISDSELAELSFEGGLPNLKKLDISGCKIKNLELYGDFDSLDTIEAQNNQLTLFKIHDKCPNLRILDLSGNKIVFFLLPSNLPSLELLYLQGGNKVRDISFLSEAPVIQTLNLHSNAVYEISSLRHLLDRVQFKWEKSGDGVLLEDCHLSIPPPEIVKEGNENILNYFREQDIQGTDTLYEAKLLIVGEGGAGKTSLCRRIIDPTLDLPLENESTKGIEIHHYEFPMENGRGFRVNVWDFGGQEIYHATHQFFLTKRSLYILLDDTRKNHKTVQDEGFKYWLEVIELLSGKSPVLIFQNEKTGRSKLIDMAGIKRRFDNVKEKFEGDLIKPESVNGIKKAIKYYVEQLPHIGEVLPKKWIDIRSEIEEIGGKIPFISQEEYFRIYEKHLERDRKKALQLSQYLHDLGVFLNFQDDLLLSQTVILQNTWATEAVFKILDDEIVKEKRGRFNSEDCKRLWVESEYAGMHPQLLALMIKFELAYQLPDSFPVTWLAPQLLSPSKPDELNGWETPGDLELRYKYEFMPKGLINRLMVRKNHFVPNIELSWKNGVFFENGDTSLLAQVSERGDEIILRARGPQRKELLSTISMDLDVLNDSFSGLNEKIAKRIPCICAKCSQSTSPEFYEYQQLIKRKEKNKLKVECRDSFEDVSVLELLDGIYFTSKDAIEDGSHSIFGVDLEVEGLKKEVEVLIQKKTDLAIELTESYDAEKKFSLKRRVKELEAEIEEKRNQLVNLDEALFSKNKWYRSKDDQSSKKNALEELLVKTNALKEGMNALRSSLEEGLESILEQLGKQDVQLLALLDLSQSSKKSLAQLFQLMDTKHFSTNEMEKMEQRLTAAVEEMLDQLPEGITKKWSELKSKSTVNPDIKGKLKMKIPIIPTILSYEKEISYDLIKLLQRIWSDLKQGKVFVERLP